MKYVDEVLVKFMSSPGQCSLKELSQVREFFETYEYFHRTFIESMFQKDSNEVFFDVSIGLIESKIRTCEWYKNYQEEISSSEV